MALNQEAVNRAKIAEAYVLNSNDMDDDYKNTLLTLLETSTLATNGISQEQKIQKMTECIQDLAVSQVGMIRHLKEVIVHSISESTKDIDRRITDAIMAADKKQCEGCRAMRHAEEVEQQEAEKRMLDEYRKRLGVADDTEQNKPNETWEEIAKGLVKKPWIYVIAGLVIVSPYGIELVRVLLNFFSR